MSPVIEVRNLTRRFGPLVAVNQLDLVVQRQEIFGLVGPDGAGKTTTLRLVLGLLTPDSGEIMVAGRDVSRDPDAVKDRIGYMAQRFGLYDDLTVDENMEYYADLFGISRSRRDELRLQLLRMTRMEPFGKRQAGRLSGGMRQKLSLMCTLLHRPEVLFLDEPTCGVDPVSRRDLWSILYELVKEGVTVFMTTSYLDEAERCNRVGLMHRGRLVRCDSPDNLRRQLAADCYEVEAEDLPAAREHLQNREGVLGVQPFGPSLHVLVNPALASPESLRKGSGAATFKLISPSLEDVFLAVLQSTEGRG
jgi:ABC-2 type transport system ATP-binding protein